MERCRGDQEMERGEKIIDASVAVKWYTPEEGTDRAVELMNKHVEGLITLTVPVLFYYEVVNALRYKPDFNPDKLKLVIASLMGLHLEKVGVDAETLTLAVEITYEKNVTVYDAAYVALAVRRNTTCITADEKMLKNLAGYPVEKL